MRTFFLSILVLLTACKTETVKPQAALSSGADQAEIRTPDQLLGELFTDVQLTGFFEDSKTFVDCTTRFPYDTITARYSRLKCSSGFDLKSFVLEHFETPPLISSGFKSDPNRSAVWRPLWG